MLWVGLETKLCNLTDPLTAAVVKEPVLPVSLHLEQGGGVQDCQIEGCNRILRAEAAMKYR